MRYEQVCIEAFSHAIPPHVVTSADIEQQLARVYDRLNLPYGRLEMMTGIRERRFFDAGTLPSQISGTVALQAVQTSKLPIELFGALIHGSVCRDQLEPATAAAVHRSAGLPSSALVLDVSNACLGLLNGMVLLANMIELGQLQAGVVVGTEVGRDLVEGTIESLLRDESATRKDVKQAFASLTIGSGSVAIVLCHRRHSHTGHRLLGGTILSDTSQYELCTGGVDADVHQDGRPRMQTDSEALLHAGVALAQQTWQQTKTELGWVNSDVDKLFTHQVGRAHRKLLLEQLELPTDRDHPTVEFLGNTGAVALPMSMALGIDAGMLSTGDRVALLGIGSGLNSIMLGIEWQSPID